MMNIQNTVALSVLVLLALTFGGCATYTVPGKAADFRALGITADEQAQMTDDLIAERMARKPAASFPAVIGVAHIQDKGYGSRSWRGYRAGNVSVSSVREIETQEDLEAFEGLPMVGAVIPLNRLVVGEVKHEIDLREAASSVQADMLFLYTFDTKFGVKTKIPAMGVITLGLFPNDEAQVTSTASGVLIDTRTGYIYALAEGTSDSSQIANAWTSSDAVEDSRLRAERAAFSTLIEQMTDAWKQVAETHAISSARRSSD